MTTPPNKPNILWAPWRMDYIKSLSPSAGQPTDGRPVTDHAAAPAAAEKEPVCFLCEAAGQTAGTEQARRQLLLVRDERGLIVLNRYPYTTGHLLVAAAEHLGDLTDLSAVQRAGLIELAAFAEQLARQAYNPQGINIGINIGRCAGAGLPGHLHLHIVPRWNGDTNFMPVLGQLRVMSQALDQSFETLNAVLRNR